MITTETAKKLMDARVALELDDLSHRAGAVATEYLRFIELLRLTTENAGKRLRPYMIMLIFEAYSGRDPREALTAAASLEFLHMAMLIHDDFMDQDTVRHGRDNVIGLYLKEYSDLATPRKQHEADNMAILAGDLLQARAYKLASSIEATTEVKQKIEDLIVSTIERVIGGQILDTQATFRNGINSRAISEHKTASYTFEAPLLIGAILGGANDKQLELLRLLGKKVGIGYQMMDDLLGVFGDAQETGKSADGDIREGKRTSLVEKFDELGSESQQKRFYEIFGHFEINDDQLDEARVLLEKSGARAAVEKELSKLGREAGEIAAKLTMPIKYKTALLTLAEAGLSRSK